jgi:hypothetical protein
MDKNAYYEISKREKLPKRCPIFGYCERRAWSVYLKTYMTDKNMYEQITLTLLENGEIQEKFDKEKVECVGAFPEMFKSAPNPYGAICWYKNFCPEIFLFRESGLGSGLAVVAGEYEYLKENKEKEWATIKEEYGHYSECSEFCRNHYRKTAKPKRKKRSAISKRLWFEIFQRDDFTCKYCGAKAEDGKGLEIDHILPIDRGGTDDIKNLQTTCKACNRGKGHKVV